MQGSATSTPVPNSVLENQINSLRDIYANIKESVNSITVSVTTLHKNPFGDNLKEPNPKRLTLSHIDCLADLIESFSEVNYQLRTIKESLAEVI